jgi:hypothetical protein
MFAIVDHGGGVARCILKYHGVHPGISGIIESKNYYYLLYRGRRFAIWSGTFSQELFFKNSFFFEVTHLDLLKVLS